MTSFMRRNLLLSALVVLLFAAACRRAQEAPTSTTPSTVSVLGKATRRAEAAAGPTLTATNATDPYPAPVPTATPGPYPYPGPTASGTAPTPAGSQEQELYLPGVYQPSASPTATPVATATPSPTPTPTIDFRALQARVRENGQELGFVKMGFHAGPGGNQTGIGEWMQRLDAAGVPFFVKSVDTAGPLVEAQQILRNSNVPHVLVYRSTGTAFDVPNYTLPPAVAAQQHWEQAKAAFPAELDPSLVWLETINEVDKRYADWLGEFAQETARLAMADGFRWAAFGWSSGEPEPAAWEEPSMLAFLRLVGENPERLAIALHEYSYLANDIAHEYPFKVGRFLTLFDVVDRHNIPRPTVLITEWGWAYDDVPDPPEALEDIAWAARLYAHYPQVKGAAIWYLGPGFADIADQVQPLIKPVTEYALGNYFLIPPPGERVPTNADQFRPLPPS